MDVLNNNEGRLHSVIIWNYCSFPGVSPVGILLASRYISELRFLQRKYTYIIDRLSIDSFCD